MDNELLVKTVRDLCKKNNIPISQLENDLNFGAGLISRWIKSSPSVDKIIDIADYFHVSLDEVVGYDQNINDEFLRLLYERTDDGTIQWISGITLAQQGCQIKLWDKKTDEHCLIPNDYTQAIYATKFRTGYILLYSFYPLDNIIYPDELILFIQPSDDGCLIKQHYSTEEIKPLWTKVLNSLGDDAPDSVKAEDFKNSFINEYSIKHEKNTINNQDINKKLLYDYVNNFKGCLICNPNTNNILISCENNNDTNDSKKFYFGNKENFGKIKIAQIHNKHNELFLLSADYVMKLSGFSWTNNHYKDTIEYKNLIDILIDVGVNIIDPVIEKDDVVTFYLKNK